MDTLQPEEDSLEKLPKETLESVISLGKLVLQFGRIKRATYHEDGDTVESDTDHTVMLGVVACAFAEQFAPKLDKGKIAQFALVHDLVETYAGDVPTLAFMSEKEVLDKAEKEDLALQRIANEFDSTLPWVAKTIEEYETLQTPEARFVKVLDKVMPKITHILNKGVAIDKQGHKSEDVEEIYNIQYQKMISSYAHDQSEALVMWKEIVSKLKKVVSE